MKTGFSKKAISIVLSATMLIAVLCVAPITAFAESTDDGLTYTVANEEVTITGYTGAGGEVNIPDTIDGKPVVALDQYAFRASTNPATVNITSIAIPDSVKTIGRMAFDGCSSLETIKLPTNVTITTTPGLFRNCSKLKSIKIPSGMTSIGNFCFQNCTNLAEVTFSEPNTVASIANSSFSGCVSLVDIVLPEGITTITTSFLNCTSLLNVTIPASVTSIDAGAFNGSNEENLTIRGNKDSYAQTFALEKGYKFVALDAGEDLFFDNLIAKIDAANKALENSAYYTKASCDELRAELESANVVKENATKQQDIDAALDSLDKKIKALVPFDFKYEIVNDEVTITGFNDDKPEIVTPSKDVVIPATIEDKPVTKIAESAFSGKIINTVAIPASVTEIGANAFKSCVYLTGATLNDGLVTIGDSAFALCQKLASCNIPATVTTIGASAFVGTALSNVTIPESVTTVKDGAFQSCYSLTKVTAAGKDTAFEGENIFANCSDKLVINAPANSKAMAYAKAKGIGFAASDIDMTAFENAVKAAEEVIAAANSYEEEARAALQVTLDNAKEAAKYPESQEAIAALAEDLSAATDDVINNHKIVVSHKFILGDVNGDGIVNVADILVMQHYIGKNIELTNEQMLAADVDGDQYVRIADVLNIQKYKAEMPVDYPIGQEQEVPEVPTFPTEPETLPPTSEPTEPTSDPSVEPSAPEGSFVLYVNNAVSWITDDGCKLFAYNPDTGDFKLMDVSDDGKYFSAIVEDTWQYIEFYRTTYDIDETTFDPQLPISAEGPNVNKWNGLPAREDNNCFIVTDDGAGKWGVYDPNEKPVEGANTIYFDNTATAWDHVYVYGWSFGLNKDFIEMEPVGNNIYKFTFPEAPAPGVAGFLFVNMDSWNGQQQTVNCAVEEGKNLYTNLTGSGTSWRGTWDVYTPAE